MAASSRFERTDRSPSADITACPQRGARSCRGAGIICDYTAAGDLVTVGQEAAECKSDYHDCYRKVYGLIRDYDKRMAVAFDDPRRSNAFLLLANIIGEGLLSAEELEEFSQEAQARIK